MNDSLKARTGPQPDQSELYPNESHHQAKTETDLTANEPDAGVIAGESLRQVGEGAGEFTIGEPPARRDSTGRSAFFVGAGILISRILGLIRQRVFAHYFGT